MRKFPHLRLVSFLLLSAVAFFTIFWLTWDYKLVVGLNALDVENGKLITINAISKMSPYSSFEEESELLLFDSGNKSFRKLDFNADKIVGIFKSPGGFLFVFPDSFGYYSFEEGQLVSTPPITYFGTEATTSLSFSCSVAVETDKAVTCFGFINLEKESYLTRVVITENGASEPQVVHRYEHNADFLAATVENNTVLLTWSDVNNPADVYYRVLRDDGGYGGKRTENWNSRVIPLIENGEPHILLRRANENIFDLLSLKSGQLKEGYTKVHILDQLVRFVFFSKKEAIVTDGVRVFYLERKGNDYEYKGVSVICGRAKVSPETVILIVQGIMVLLLIVFSFTLVRRGGLVPVGGRYIPPSIVLRVSAFLVDSIIVSVAATGVFILILSLKGVPLKIHLLSSANQQILQAVAISLMVIYGTVFEVFKYSTPGKMLFHLRIAAANGMKPRLSSIVLRNLMKPVDIMFAFFFITPLVMLLTPFNQRLGDILSQTIVIQAGIPFGERIIPGYPPRIGPRGEDEKDGGGEDSRQS